MNLSNCAEFDNLTLNCSVGTKLSIAGYFPFAHFIWYNMLTTFTRRKKYWSDGKVFKQQLYLAGFLNSFVLNMQITLFHFKKDKTYYHCTINPKTSIIILVSRSKLESKKCIIWIIILDCGIVWDFTLPKSAICCRIRQCCQIGQSARDFLYIGMGHYVQTLESYWAPPFSIITRSRENLELPFE